MKKLSVLGLVLMAASAVTAAIVPAKKDKSASNNGMLATGGVNDTTNSVVSCTVINGAANNECTVTAESVTTTANSGLNNQSTVTVNGAKHQTLGNTSQTAGNGQATSSTRTV